MRGDLRRCPSFKRLRHSLRHLWECLRTPSRCPPTGRNGCSRPLGHSHDRQVYARVAEETSPYPSFLASSKLASHPHNEEEAMSENQMQEPPLNDPTEEDQQERQPRQRPLLDPEEESNYRHEEEDRVERQDWGNETV